MSIGELHRRQMQKDAELKWKSYNRREHQSRIESWLSFGLAVFVTLCLLGVVATQIWIKYGPK